PSDEIGPKMETPGTRMASEVPEATRRQPAHSPTHLARIPADEGSRSRDLSWVSPPVDDPGRLDRPGGPVQALPARHGGPAEGPPRGSRGGSGRRASPDVGATPRRRQPSGIHSAGRPRGTGRASQ